MRKIKNKLLIIFIIVNVLFIGLLPMGSRGQAVDLSFTFDDNILFDENITSFDESFNLRQSSEYTEIYNATYSFTNGNLPIEWIDGSGADTSSEISSLYAGHSNVLNLTDNSGANRASIQTIFPQDINTIIEFWIAKDDITASTTEINIRENNDILVDLFFSDNDLSYFDGSFHNIKLNFFTIEQFFHIRVDLKDSTNTFDIYINTILEGSGLNYLVNSINGSDTIRFITNFGDTGYSAFFDGIGFSTGRIFEIDDFSDDTPDQEPGGWISNNDANCFTNISTTKNLTIFDGNSAGIAEISRPFNESSFGFEQNIIFNWTTSTVSPGIDPNNNEFLIRFISNDIIIFGMQILENDLFYSDANNISYNSIGINIIVPNVFLTVQLWFRHDDSQVDIFFDGIFPGDGLNLPYILNADIDSLDTIEFNTFRTTQDTVDYSGFVDNIIINTENYTIGSNLIPFLNISETLQEVDRYEFAFKEPTIFNADGSSNPNNWTDFENPSGDLVVISPELDGSFDKMVFVDSNVIDNFRGIIKGNLDLSGNFINVSVGYVPFFMFGDVNQIWIRLYASDNTIIAKIEVLANFTLNYDDASGTVDTGRTITLLSRYDFNIFINYEIDQGILIYTENNTVIEIFTFPLINTGKAGLLRVEVFSLIVDSNEVLFLIDYVGIYVNGRSKVDVGIDFGVAELDLGSSTWNFQDNNLVYIVGNGVFHLSAVSDFLFEGATISILRDSATYDNTVSFINLYDNSFVSDISDPLLLITVIGDNFSVDSLKIDGVLLNESSNSYNLIFEHGSIDTNESFFSVVGNEMFFTHTANDTNLEFIQARFNINDVSSTGYTASFRSIITNNAFGFFRVNFTDLSNLIQIPNLEKTTRFILTQNLTIRDLVVLITDRDDNSITGTTTGSLSEIELLVTENIRVSILTEALIVMIVPLILILIPSLLISSIYGRSLLVPTFLLMSVIAVASGIIPTWLFFIIAISNAVFLLKGREVER